MIGLENVGQDRLFNEAILEQSVSENCLRCTIDRVLSLGQLGLPHSDDKPLTREK